MSYVTILHALGLQMHQPPGNLQLLIETNVPEAQQIIYAYDRATRYAHKYPHSARFHVGFSGILLEQLKNPAIIDSYRHFIDIPAMLQSYAEAKNIELVGTGYFHPIFPLMPREHWRDQLSSEQQLMEEVFGRKPRGFWAPEMAFCMEMIPTLADLGYEYVILEAAHIQPQGENLNIFQPYRVCYEGACITVLPRHHALSAAQEHGLTPIQLVDTLQPYHGASLPPRVLTTWSNGENSAWLRDEAEGFFLRFFAPYMEHLENAQYPVQPILLSEWLRAHPPTVHAEIHAGYDFGQWRGSERQHQALSNLHQLSQRYQQIKRTHSDNPLLSQVYRELLEAEASCLLFWGETWLEQLRHRLIHIEKLLNKIENPQVEVVAEPQQDDISELAMDAPVEQPVLPSPVMLAKKPIMKTRVYPNDSSDNLSVQLESSDELLDSQNSPATDDSSDNLAVQSDSSEPSSSAELLDSQNSPAPDDSSDNLAVQSDSSEPSSSDELLDSQNSPATDDSSDNLAVQSDSSDMQSQLSPTISSHHSVDRQTRQASITKKKNSRYKK